LAVDVTGCSACGCLGIDHPALFPSQGAMAMPGPRFDHSRWACRHYCLPLPSFGEKAFTAGGFVPRPFLLILERETCQVSLGLHRLISV
jgi:hypothetical protein